MVNSPFILYTRTLFVVFILSLTSGCGKVWESLSITSGSTTTPPSSLSYRCSTQLFLENSPVNFSMGDGNVETQDDSGNADYVVAQSASLLSAGTLQSLSIDIAATGGAGAELILGVYDSTGSGGGPGNLLAQTAAFTPVVGWNQQPVTSPLALSAGTYWLAFFTNNNSMVFLYESAGSGMYESSAFGGTMPSTYPTSGGGAITYTASLFATLSTSSTTNITNTPDTPSITGSGVTYSVSPALPAGISLDPSTGVISGSPTVTSAQSAYTVTASNSAGSTSAIVNITTANGWQVNDLSHDADNAGGPGSCSSTTYGTCTLRAALDEINTGGSVMKAILLPAGSTTLSSSLGALAVSQAVNIYGDCADGTIVDGGGATNVFAVTAPSSFNDLTVQNGYAYNSSGAGFGIGSLGNPTFTVTLNEVTVQGNKVAGPGPGYENGAGIDVGGISATEEVALIINNSIFYNNQDNSTNTPVGGAISFESYSEGAINNSLFLQNSAGNGGAINHNGTSLTINDCLFDDNSATPGDGGALDTGSEASGNVTFTNDTFYSNFASNGGGVLSTNAASVSFLNCTIVGNSASASNAVYLDNGGGSATFQNTLFQGNLVDGATGDDCGGSSSSLGNNLTNSTADDCNLTRASDITGTTALLGSLQNNGGTTDTLALLAGSPGIGEANPAACPATDQRGDPRPIPTSCDIGAYEYTP